MKLPLIAEQCIDRLMQAGIMPHHTCEYDGWYSCPLSDMGTLNGGIPHKCNCGAEEHNLQVKHAADALRTAIRAA